MDFLVDPSADHQSQAAVTRANTLLVPWLKAVIGMRLPSSGGTLRPIDANAAWLGDLRTGEAEKRESFRGNERDAVWLPDELTARAWSVFARAR